MLISIIRLYTIFIYKHRHVNNEIYTHGKCPFLYILWFFLLSTKVVNCNIKDLEEVLGGRTNVEQYQEL